MSHYFEEQIKSLELNMIEMGGYLEHAISNTSNALVNNDVKLAKKTKKFAKIIDDKEREIEVNCFKLLMQQPLASDFRQVSSAMKMITDMERIGDQCEDICCLIIQLSEINPGWEFIRISKMSEEIILMVNNAVDSFVKKDLELAKKVVESDDSVDDLFYEIKSELIEAIRKSKVDGEEIIDLLMIAKYFERIGDHAVNIAEWVIYSITGVHNALEEE